MLTPSRRGGCLRGSLGGAEYDALLRGDFDAFAQRAFHLLYPRTEFLTNWHLHVIAARLAAVRDGRIRRLAINLPPRHPKSLLASVAFPAWIPAGARAARRRHG